MENLAHAMSIVVPEDTPACPKKQRMDAPATLASSPDVAVSWSLIIRLTYALGGSRLDPAVTK